MGWVALCSGWGLSRLQSEMTAAGTVGWGLAGKAFLFSYASGSIHEVVLCRLVWASSKVVSGWYDSESKNPRQQSVSCVAFYGFALEVTSAALYSLQVSPCLQCSGVSMKGV